LTGFLVVNIVSLFDQKPDLPSVPVILSASRMTDMAAFYPGDIIREINARLEKGIILHTLVIWTKHPVSLFNEPLYSFLRNLKKNKVQVFLQLTITGMGQVSMGKTFSGKPFIPEPLVPTCKDSLSFLGRLVELVGNPERINLRIDPLLRIKDVEGNIFSNKQLFSAIALPAVAEGIKSISFSFLEKNVYKKIGRRFESIGLDILPLTKEERKMTRLWFSEFARSNNIRINACCVEDFPVSSCVDGHKLMNLHDEKWPVNTKKPRTRVSCDCTKSIDIGGWPPKKCFSGCVYCYSSPVIKGL